MMDVRCLFQLLLIVLQAARSGRDTFGMISLPMFKSSWFYFIITFLKEPFGICMIFSPFVGYFFFIPSIP